MTWWENALKWLVLCSLWPWEPIHFYDNFLFTITMITGTVYPVSHPSLLRICCINFVALRMKSDIPKGGIIDITISSSPSYFLPAIYYYYYYYSLSIHLCARHRFLKCLWMAKYLCWLTLLHCLEEYCFQHGLKIFRFHFFRVYQVQFIHSHSSNGMGLALNI